MYYWFEYLNTHIQCILYILCISRRLAARLIRLSRHSPHTQSILTIGQWPHEYQIELNHKFRWDRISMKSLYFMNIYLTYIFLLQQEPRESVLCVILSVILNYPECFAGEWMDGGLLGGKPNLMDSPGPGLCPWTCWTWPGADLGADLGPWPDLDNI